VNAMFAMVAMAVAWVAVAVASLGQGQTAHAGDQNSQDQWAQDVFHGRTLWV
jgi:hypothetical protein